MVIRIALLFSLVYITKKWFEPKTTLEVVGTSYYDVFKHD